MTSEPEMEMRCISQFVSLPGGDERQRFVAAVQRYRRWAAALTQSALRNGHLSAALSECTGRTGALWLRVSLSNNRFSLCSLSHGVKSYWNPQRPPSTWAQSSPSVGAFSYSPSRPADGCPPLLPTALLLMLGPLPLKGRLEDFPLAFIWVSSSNQKRGKENKTKAFGEKKPTQPHKNTPQCPPLWRELTDRRPPGASSMRC